MDAGEDEKSCLRVAETQKYCSWGLEERMLKENLSPYFPKRRVLSSLSHTHKNYASQQSALFILWFFHFFFFNFLRKIKCIYGRECWKGKRVFSFQPQISATKKHKDDARNKNIVVIAFVLFYVCVFPAFASRLFLSSSNSVAVSSFSCLFSIFLTFLFLQF